MKTTNDIHEKILNQPSYWVEGVNGFLYDAVVSYMEANNLNRTKLADHLGISKGRVSQILNDGEINFSLEKIIQIALKVGKFPVFEFQDKQAYLQKESKLSNVMRISLNYNFNSFSTVIETKKDKEVKIISLKPHNVDNYQLAVR